MKIIDPAIAPYEIHIDDNSHDVVQPTNNTDKKGNIFYKRFGYFSNLSGALLKIIKLKVNKDDKIMTITEYLERYKEVGDSVTHLIKE